MGAMLYDITRTLTPRTAVFPGDTPVSLTPVMQMRHGDSCNVTSITMSAHAGTHVDAPKHYSDDGAGIDAVPLDVLIGPARVVTLLSTMITVEDLESVSRIAYSVPDTQYAIRPRSRFSEREAERGSRDDTRLLIHTPSSEVPDDMWNPNFTYFTPEAAEWLGLNGIRVIGVDTPSVDPASSKDLPAHKAFLKHGVIIMENLCLRGVPDGDYELLALPLKIEGNDAAPARVVLRSLRV
jgi:arylformamidase